MEEEGEVGRVMLNSEGKWFERRSRRRRCGVYFVPR